MSNAIQTLRGLRGYTVEELAKRAQTTASTIRLAEETGRPITAKLALRVGHALGVDPALVARLPRWDRSEPSGRLRILRTRRGMTQRQLAERAGVALQTITDWEADRVEPKPGLLDFVCVALTGRGRDVLRGRDPWPLTATSPTWEQQGGAS